MASLRSYCISRQGPGKTDDTSSNEDYCCPSTSLSGTTSSACRPADMCVAIVTQFSNDPTCWPCKPLHKPPRQCPCHPEHNANQDAAWLYTSALVLLRQPPCPSATMPDASLALRFTTVQVKTSAEANSKQKHSQPSKVGCTLVASRFTGSRT